MDVELLRVSADEKEILRNLLEKYDYEFSLYDERDVNAIGLYGYSYLDNYWTEPNRWAYFIKVSGKLAGFVMVNDMQDTQGVESDFSLAEFFVMYKYRRQGVGKRAFLQAVGLHKGVWQLRCHPKNVVSVSFWDRMVNEVAPNNYTLFRAHPNAGYDDGSLGNVYVFKV